MGIGLKRNSQRINIVLCPVCIDLVLQSCTTLVIVTYLTYVIVADLLPDVDSPTVCLFVLVCHVLSCDMHVTSSCHSSTVHLFGIDTSLWYCPPLQRPTEGETAPSCTAALLEAVLQCVSLEEVVLENCSFGMQVCEAYCHVYTV